MDVRAIDLTSEREREEPEGGWANVDELAMSQERHASCLTRATCLAGR